MKRRIALVALTFVILLLLYVVYYQVNKNGDSSPWRYTRRDVPSNGQATTLRVAKDIHVEHESTMPAFPPVLMEYDNEHNLRTKYTAQRWEPRENGFFFVKPVVEWYLRGGQMITLSAERGIAVTREVNGQRVIRSGKLEENVVVLMDRSTDPRRGPLEDRPDDAVRIHIDYIEFDQDKLSIQTDSDVEMHAREADTYGKGLWASWSEAPLMLRELRIERGDRMVIREGQDRLMKQISLPGTSSPSADMADASAAKPAAAAAAPGKPAAATKPAPAKPAPAATRNASTAPASLKDLASKSGSARDSALGDTYTAEFIGNVEVNAGTQYLHGADVLQLTFELKQGERKKYQSASAPASASHPATSAPSATPMVLTWKGPLVLHPTPTETAPLASKIDVAARGAKMEMADGRTKAICKSFDYHSANEHGALTGTDDEPAQLEVAMPDSTPENLRYQKFMAPVLRFQRDVEKQEIVVNLEGKGSMYLPGKLQSKGQSQPANDLRKTGDFGGQETMIEWDKQVEARFGQRVSGRSGRKEEYLRQAHFTGNVDIRIGQSQRMKAQQLDLVCVEPKTAADSVNLLAKLHAEGDVDFQDLAKGDYVKGQTVDVEMDLAPGLRNQPKHAWASGNVTARQANRDISADSFDLAFVRVADERTGEVRSKPGELEATGNVHLDDHSDPNSAKRVTAAADHITANLQEKTATLSGKPAKATQVQWAIEGSTITIDGKKGLARVPGVGRLTILTDVDLSGARLREPMPITVDWTKGLVYDDAGRNCVVDGDVDVKTTDERIRCDTATLTFLASMNKGKKTGSSQPSTRESTAIAVSPMKLQNIAMVVATGKKVIMEQEKKDENGILIQAMQLQTTSVTYVAQTQKVTCDNAGYLMMADYRPPEPPKPQDPDATADGAMPADFVQRPSQSAFSWDEKMSMVQSEIGLVVEMFGNVRMRQTTGDELLLGGHGLEMKSYHDLKAAGELGKYMETSSFHLPDSMRAGEFMMMNCDYLLAQFGPYSATKKVETDEQGGMRIGPLERLDARGFKNVVVFEDKPRKVSVACKSILYQRSMDVAIILGSLPNEPPRLAQVTYIDRQSGGLQSVTAPRILWYPKADKVTIEKGEGHAVR